MLQKEKHMFIGHVDEWSSQSLVAWIHTCQEMMPCVCNGGCNE